MSKRVSIEEVQHLTASYMVWAHKLEEIEKEMAESTGETRAAYALVYNDYLWRLQSTVGRLWYAIGGSEQMNPFTPAPESQSETTLPSECSDVVPQ